jgi:hypothetical protein
MLVNDSPASWERRPGGARRPLPPGYRRREPSFRPVPTRLMEGGLSVDARARRYSARAAEMQLESPMHSCSPSGKAAPTTAPELSRHVDERGAAA